MATMKSHLEKTTPEKDFSLRKCGKKFVFVKNGAIGWEVCEMREKWGNCVTLTLNVWRFSGLALRKHIGGHWFIIPIFVSFQGVGYLLSLELGFLGTGVRDLGLAMIFPPNKGKLIMLTDLCSRVTHKCIALNGARRSRSRPFWNCFYFFSLGWLKKKLEFWKSLNLNSAQHFIFRNLSMIV